jgi:hypothetical protein
MQNQKELFRLYQSRTGKTNYTPKSENENPVHYQVPRADTIKTYGSYP